VEVRFEKVVKRYGSFHAVKDLDLTIQAGALHFLLGPSGCGKTTTLRMLAGLETPSAGRILFGGNDVTNVPAAERGIGMVFQNYALWPHMTVRKNIEYGLKLKKLPGAEQKQRLDEVLGITQLASFADRLPGQLSGGQQQRVALARALAIRPSVLLLDEPLSNLDAKLRLEMRDNITRIHRQTGITTVYVTHDQKEALSMGTHVSIMRAGILVQTDAPRGLYHRPATPFIAGFIGETNLVEGTYKGKDGSLHTVETPFGLIKAGAAVGSYQAGTPVTLSFRPEAIRADFADAATAAGEGVNRLELVLEHLTYLGESEQLQLRGAFAGKNGPGLKAAVFNPPDHDLADGSPVRCRLEPSDVLVLPREADLKSGT
jgi:ABC-type Fe3+/spermidine/putrescine transport system ATPase subunit